MTAMEEARIKRLEDIEAIKVLKGKYAYYADTANWQGFMDLIVEGAVWDFGEQGTYIGKEEILRFSRDIILKKYPYTLHHFYNIFIDVKGDTATGIWYFIVPATNQIDNRAEWLAGVYRETYVRLNGEWKFKKVVGEIQIAAPHLEGWVNK